MVRTLSPSASGPAIYGPNTLSVLFRTYLNKIFFNIFNYILNGISSYIWNENQEYKTRIHSTVEDIKTVYVSIVEVELLFQNVSCYNLAAFWEWENGNSW